MEIHFVIKSMPVLQIESFSPSLDKRITADLLYEM